MRTDTTAHSVFGDPRAMLDIWPELSTSPILTHFRWSPLVELAFDTNRAFFLPATSAEPYTSHQPHLTNAERYPVIPGLMAIHVRRGDFEAHCRFLGSFAADYAAFSALRGLPDRFVPPRTGNAEADADVHRSHCYPSVQEIVARVREVRASAAGQGLERLHIMTNGDGVFIAELRTALGRDQDWKMITSSRDLSLNWEQKYVAQAVDMLVGQRAQVLIGNGVSSMSLVVCLWFAADSGDCVVLNDDVEYRHDAYGESDPARQYEVLVIAGGSWLYLGCL